MLSIPQDARNKMARKGTRSFFIVFKLRLENNLDTGLNADMIISRYKNQ